MGALVPDKGHDHLLHALAPLRQEGSEPTLVIAGQGPQGEFLAGLAAQLELSDQIEF